MFSNQDLEEIRRRIPVSDVVRRSVTLNRKGREWLGRCPFHDEKTASFTVNDEKGFYHCFGCGAHGDLFKFIMDTSKATFAESVEQLAQECNLQLKKRAYSGKSFESHWQILTFAEQFFAEMLLEADAKSAQQVLRRRGFDRKSAARYGIGFAPKGSRLKTALATERLDLAIAYELGLLSGNENNPRDFFQNRITIAIRNGRGQCIAFGARALEAGQQPKYLNSKDSALFSKGKTLYGMDRLRGAKRSDQVVLVEGYFDSIAIDALDGLQAIAPLGTALGPDQLQLAWRYGPQPLLLFDGDPAGRKALTRSVERALPIMNAERQLNYALLPEGEDADSLIRSGKSNRLVQAIAGQKPVADWLFLQAVEESEPGSPAFLAQLRAKLNGWLREIKNADLKRSYHHYFEQREQEFTPKSARDSLENSSNPNNPSNQRTDGRGSARSFKPRSLGVAPANQIAQHGEMILLKFFYQFPQQAENWLEELSEARFKTPEVAQGVQRLIRNIASEPDAQTTFDEGENPENSLMLIQPKTDPEQQLFQNPEAESSQNYLREALALKKTR